jgi:hypothetical protein
MNPDLGCHRTSLENVVRVLNTDTGSYAEIRATRPGLLRVCAHVPGAIGESDVTGLRVLLIADLLARAAELSGLQVLTVVAFDDESAGQAGTLERAVAALRIHPHAAHTRARDAETSLGGAIDVHLAGYEIRLDDRQSGLVARVGAARVRGDDEGAAARDLLAGHEHDPLAFRLALMSFPVEQAADLTKHGMDGASETVGQWRRRVAEWAERPSRPVPTHIAETLRAAFDQLDTVSALALLRDLASDRDAPTGVKFETFLYADRVLGLDLASEIGRLG